MMELVMTRIAKRKDYTIGRLSINPAPSPAGGGSGGPQKWDGRPFGYGESIWDEDEEEGAYSYL